MISDQAIEDTLRAAFAPHRCDVEFQTDSANSCRKVALVIRALHAGPRSSEREFVVEGIRLDALRRREALLQYIEDVRTQLAHRKITFATHVRWMSKPWQL